MHFSTRQLFLATLAALAVTVQAAPIASSESSFLVARDLITEPLDESVTFEARDLVDAEYSESDELYARQVLGDEEVDQLIARGFGKFLKKAARGAMHVASAVLRRDVDDETEAVNLYVRDLIQRDLISEDEADELMARGFGKFLKKAARGAMHVASAVLRRDLNGEEEFESSSDLYARDVADIDADLSSELYARDVLGDEQVELITRGFGKFLKKAARGAMHVASAVLRRDVLDEDEAVNLYVRDLIERDVLSEDQADDLMARGFGKFLKKAARGAMHVASAVLRRDLDDATEQFDASDLYARDVLGDEQVELITRGFGKFLKKAARGAMHVASAVLRRDVLDEDEAVNLYVRDLIERDVLSEDQADDLMARGFGKFLKKAARGAMHVASAVL